MSEHTGSQSTGDWKNSTESQELVVRTATATYPVVVAPGLLEQLPEYLKRSGNTGTLWLISDSEVFPHYGALVEATVTKAGYAVRTHIIPAGEASKNYEQLWHIYTWMISERVERRDQVLALGGGVVGDIAGFAAATILRGIRVIQIPTTLLAMVDAAIGGKTGINHPLGKNLIGAFHHPSLVLSDTNTLATLPIRELRSGWAEVIKHGMIRDEGLFQSLETHAATFNDPASIRNPDHAVRQEMSAIIRRAAAVKVAVVNEDEREQRLRMILNYGHTIGHAIEAATGYHDLLHGEAVAIGMHAAARIAAGMGLLPQEIVGRQQRLLEAYGLPTRFPAHLDRDKILEFILYDKKVRDRRVQWILPIGIGSVVIRDDVPHAIVEQALS